MKKMLIALTVCAFALGTGAALADDKTPAAPADQAKMKAEKDAAKAAEAKMTPEEKAAAKQAKRAKKHQEMTQIEQSGNPASGSAKAAAVKKSTDATKNDPKALKGDKARQEALKDQEKKSTEGQ